MNPSEKEFIAESEELLEEAVNLVLSLQESAPGREDPDTVNSLFRIMHTLKGMSGIYGFRFLTDLSHGLESLLDDVRMGQIPISRGFGDFLLRFIDVLRSMLSSMREGRPMSDAEVASHLADIEAFRASIRKKADEPEISDRIEAGILKVLSEYEEHRLKSSVREGKNIFLLSMSFPLAEFDTSLKRISAEIKKHAEIVSTMPTSENVPAGHIGFNLMVGTAAGAGVIASLGDFEIKTLVAAAGEEEEKDVADVPPDAETPAPGHEYAAKITANTVRVDIGKIDRLLNTIEEISLARHSIVRIRDEMIDSYGYSPLLVDIQRVSQNLERRISELQHQVLEIRMVPIGQMFAKLSQVIRRYVRDSGKKIGLELYGEDTEIDKSLAEDVIDPLVHIVRNAIDHGIEPGGERLAHGKMELGSVVLSAYQEGSNVVIEVRDDGRGIDVEKVRSKAVEGGIIDPSRELGRKDILELIFAPGFSTRDSADEVSGRGVGLDIVRRKLSSMGGIVDIETRPGQGATFSLRLPITVAIIKSLLVRVGAETFAMPVMSIAEAHVLEGADVQMIEGRSVYNQRGSMIPVVRLADVLRIRGDSGTRSMSVVVGSGDRTLGIAVDELLQQHDVVVKPLGDYFEGLRFFAGAAEIGKHEVIMVLDAESIIAHGLDKKGLINV